MIIARILSTETMRLHPLGDLVAARSPVSPLPRSASPLRTHTASSWQVDHWIPVMPVDLGLNFAGGDIQRYLPDEIGAWEKTVGVRLPADYRTFLCEVGSTLLFGGGGQFPTGLFLYPLDLGSSRAASCFEAPRDWIGRLLLVIGEDRLRQDLIIMRIRDGVGDAVASISHEHGGEDWLEVANELGAWESFSEYLSRLAGERGFQP